MRDAFLNYIREQELIREGESILLAVSGGVDSVVMAQLFNTAGIQIGIAHCNFQLRGEESDGDEEFVNALGKEWSVEVYKNRFNTQEFADSKGISIQMAARELRYTWFRELLKNEPFDKIALAHNKDDQLETIIFNLTKGTGISGLTGMKPINGHIIRPLLFAERGEIENYAKKENMTWREDSSNQSIKYSRNLIRHKVIPELKSINPNILNTLDLTLIRMMEAESALNDLLISFVEKNVRREEKDTYISISALKNSRVPTLALHTIASQFGFNYQQCVSIISSLEGVGKLFYGNNSIINIDREELIISPMNEEDFHSVVYEIQREDTEVEISAGLLKISEIPPEDVNFSSSKEEAFLDLDKLKFPLRIRHWAAGDWFIPLGMDGKKKISDLMIDEKIPLNLKNRVFVLESGEEIAWVIGHRIDDRFKITESTARVFKMKYGKV